MKMRQAEINRKTAETDISLSLKVDGVGKSNILITHNRNGVVLGGFKADIRSIGGDRNVTEGIGHHVGIGLVFAGGQFLEIPF